MRQLGLFAGPDPVHAVRARAEALASRLPAHVRLGTSSWTFPGWGGIVYDGAPTDAELVRDGLREYARFPLFRTVGIDRAYYAPLTAGDLATYARDLPVGFSAVTKVFSGITTLVEPKTGAPVPTFLDVGTMEAKVLTPIAQSFRAFQGPIVIELAPQRAPWRLEPNAFVDRLGAFLARMPRDFRFAVELRNREFLTRDYVSVLRQHQVAHVFNWWTEMPDIGVQMRSGALDAAPFAVVRAMLPPGMSYDDMKAKYAPFDRIVAPSEILHRDVVDLVARCGKDQREAFVIIGNKTEGSAPLTVLALAERLVAR